MRVLLGGLPAGVVANIFEFVTNGVVLASGWEATMKALGHQMPGSAPVAFYFVGIHHGDRGCLALRGRTTSVGARSKDRSAHGAWLLDLRVRAAELRLRRHGLVPQAPTFSRLRVRAVDVGDIPLHYLPNRLLATTRRGRAVVQSASTTARPVRQALVEMGSSGYAVSAPRRVRRECRGIVLRRFPLFPSN
jgi:hypothetical protein